MIFTKNIAALLILCSWLSTSIAEPQRQSLEQIRQAALDYATTNLPQLNGQRIEIEVGYLDQRLRLAPCDQALAAKRLSGTRRIGKTTITVRCSGRIQWAIHVPINIKAFAATVVANQTLGRQIPIRHEALRIEEKDISTLRSGYFSRIEDVINRLPKRNIHLGTTIAPQDLDTSKVIRKGQKVIIISQGGGIAVRMQGKALDNAALGDMVTVQNLSSKRNIDAIVIEAGVVKVPM